MLYLYFPLVGLLILIVAIAIDLLIGGLAAAILGGARRPRPDPVLVDEPGGWGTAFGLVVALLIGFLAWGFYTP
jgi:hypothetical protein